MRIEHRHLARRRWIVGKDFDKRPRRKISFDMIAGPLDQSQPQPSQRDIRLCTRDRDHHGDLDTPKLANRSAVRSKAHRHEGGSGRQLISNLMPQGRENRGAQTLRLTVCTVGSSMYLSVQHKKLADVQSPASAVYPRDYCPEGPYGRGRLEFVRSGARVSRRRSCTPSEHFVHVGLS
jgi:hypothetical protein